MHQSHKGRHVVDTSDSTALSQVQPDGRIVTETRRTTEHDEQNDVETPDDDKDALSHSDEEQTRKESSHRYTKTKVRDRSEYAYTTRVRVVFVTWEYQYNSRHLSFYNSPLLPQ